MPIYFDRYINLAGDMELLPALEEYGEQFVLNEQKNFIDLGDKVYAHGKWTVKETIQHLIDCERVFAYRALRIARADKTPLPGFDENAFSDASLANNRSLASLLEEFIAVRRSSTLLFRSFSDEMFQQEGTFNGMQVAPVAIGFIIAGHTIHHMNVLRERYYPLL